MQSYNGTIRFQLYWDYFPLVGGHSKGLEGKKQQQNIKDCT